ncbi:WGR domain containing protein [uncultured Caudovirales phage]|uniref:WGR domain containing protein n=1 Tax=uncultured Caudovirales phage TaxID=2100421 RepID=A0A6J5L652_9CAUD|nr:WGR domain containing protein [uncultured Caudovirales phage]
MVKVYEWLNKEKARYYKITIETYENTNIVINYLWGGCHSNRGGRKNICVQTEEEAHKCIAKMMRKRKSRGYELIAP